MHWFFIVNLSSKLLAKILYLHAKISFRCKFQEIENKDEKLDSFYNSMQNKTNLASSLYLNDSKNLHLKEKFAHQYAVSAKICMPHIKQMLNLCFFIYNSLNIDAHRAYYNQIRVQLCININNNESYKKQIFPVQFLHTHFQNTLICLKFLHPHFQNDFLNSGFCTLIYEN